MGYDPTGTFSFWDALDVGSFVDSIVNFVKKPSWSNAGWLALDTVGLLPLVPSPGTVKAGSKIVGGVDKVKDTSNVVKKGWNVGDNIIDLTRAGNNPTWDTARNRYWKNEAFYNPGKYNADNLARMKNGKLPLVWDAGKKVSMELHHINPRYLGGGNDFGNLQRLRPSQHALIDPYRGRFMP